jgi:hypothetical protein
MGNNLATVEDYEKIYNAHLTDAEHERVETLLEYASALLRTEASNRGYNLDLIIARDGAKKIVAKMVVLASVKRAMHTNEVTEAPLEQFSQSAMGYTVSGTYLNPGDDIYFLNNELKRLGINRKAQGFFIDLWQ